MHDVIVIGAGQAGLAAGYYLKQRNARFILLDAKKRAGDTWRNRYDSLVLFTPKQYSGLPGYAFPGDPMTLPSKDEAADYLEQYAAHFNLPVELNSEVTKLWKEGETFHLMVNGSKMNARRVIVATGPFQTKYIPAFANQIAPDVVQLHSSEYRNSEQLQHGNVLVVGGGNSGAQIAVELSAGHMVQMSVSRPVSYKPLFLLGKSIFWYFENLGFLRANIDTPLGNWIKKRPEQVYGYDLKRLAKAGKVSLVPRAVRAERDVVFFENGTKLQVSNIIWTTGFKRNYDWIHISETFNREGEPLHSAGISVTPGLYFVGMPWQSSRGSALMGWVQYDAKRIFDAIYGEVT